MSDTVESGRALKKAENDCPERTIKPPVLQRGGSAPAQATTWHVQYRDEDGRHLRRYLTPEGAVQAACEMMDEGIKVDAIGVGHPDNAIGPAKVADIYKIWLLVRRAEQTWRTANR